MRHGIVAASNETLMKTIVLIQLLVVKQISMG
jgi:hypothetical protein